MLLFSFAIPSGLTRVPDRLTEISRSFDFRCSNPPSPTSGPVERELDELVLVGKMGQAGVGDASPIEEEASQFPQAREMDQADVRDLRSRQPQVIQFPQARQMGQAGIRDSASRRDPGISGALDPRSRASPASVIPLLSR